MGAIAEMLEPELIHDSNRGSPLSPAVKVCIALGMYAAGHFQRIAGLCGGVSQFAARKALKEVTKALVVTGKITSTCLQIWKWKRQQTECGKSSTFLDLHLL